ncbi:MAG TPA: NAD(P)H-dependent oxidoreductase [Drouetiella sp.]
MPVETKTIDVLDGLNWRYATKKFDATKKIPASAWEKVEAGLRLSPSSFGLQPYRFVVITDPKIKEQLVPISYEQRQVADCSHLVVLCRLDVLTEEHVNHLVDVASKTRNTPPEAMQPIKERMIGYINRLSKEELENWMAKQAYIALGNLMTVASSLQIDNCPMEGISQADYDRVLDLPSKGCRSLVACALGYRAEDDKYQNLAKVRFPASELFIHIN